MAYIKTTWVNNQTPLNATNMNHIEEGIEAIDQSKLSAVDTSTTNEQVYGKAPNGSQKMIDATSNPSADVIAKYNANGNLESGTPVKDTDVANKAYVASQMGSRLQKIRLTYDGTSIKRDGVTQTFSQIRTLVNDLTNEVEINATNLNIIMRYTAYEDDALWFGSFYKISGVNYLNRLIINSNNQIEFDDDGMQKLLDSAQMNAVNSGVTSAKVAQYDGYATSKQDKLSQTQLNAVNSGITSAKVTTYDNYSTTKQDKMTAGKGITIENNEVSLTSNYVITAMTESDEEINLTIEVL